jgi:hypothetical protein
MITGFLMLDGLSVAIDQELRKPEMQPIIAQLARKYLRRGPSSPEWALAIMFVGSVGTIHAYNVKQAETQEQLRGNGSATGPGSSKFSKLISGATKILKAVGIFGGGGGGGGGGLREAGGGGGLREATTPAPVSANITSRYTPQPAPPPKATQPAPPKIQELAEDDDDDDDDGTDQISLNSAPWG